MRISCQLFLAKSHVFLYYIVYNRVQSTLQQSESEISNMFKKNSTSINLCLNVSTTPIMAMGCRLKMFLKPVWEGKMHEVTKIGIFRPLFCVNMLGKSTNYSTGTRPLCSTF